MPDGCGPASSEEGRPLRLSHAFNAMLGRWIAVVSDRHLANGDAHTNVLAHAFLVSEEECFAWFQRMQRERPWEKDSLR